MKAITRYLQDPFHLLLALLAAFPMALVLMYIGQNAFNHPYFDMQVRTAPLALAVAADGFRPSQIIQPHDGQLAVMHNVTNIITTLTTNWNIPLEAYITFTLALGAWAALVVLMARRVPDVAPFGAVVASVLIFSVHQNTNWLITYVMSWYWTHLFTMLVVAVLALGRPSWGRLLVAAVFAFGATFSFGNGVLSWLAGGVILLAFGYRKPSYLAVWGVLAVIAALLYIQLAGIGIGQPSDANARADITLTNFGAIGFFAVNLFANPLVLGQTTLALAVTIFALLTFAVNMGVLLFAWRDVQTAAMWGAVFLYGLAIVALVSVARYADYPDKELAAFYAWYRTATVPLWVGMGLTVTTVTRRLWAERPSDWRGGLLAVNLVVGAIAGVLFGYASLVNDAHPLGTSGIRYREEWGMYEDCYVRYLFTQDWWTDADDRCGGSIDNALTSFDKSLLGSEVTNELSRYGLTLFAHVPQATLAPPEAVVVVDEPHPWSAYHMTDYLLDGVPSAQVHHIMQVGRPKNNPLDEAAVFENLYTLDESTRLTAALLATDAPQIWWLRQADAPHDNAADTRAALLDAGYATVDTTHTLGLSSFTLTRYDRFSGDAPHAYRFGDALTLVGWTTSATCGDVTLTTYWTTDAPPSDPYSLTVQLAAGTPPPDGQLSGVPAHVWTAGHVYIDERPVSLPCDADAGLQIGVYSVTDGVRLPVYDADTPTNADLAPLAIAF
jgi:hypothetical protein